MIPSSGIIYYHAWHYKPSVVHSSQFKVTQKKQSRRSFPIGHIMGIGLIAIALGGLTGPLTPFIRMEASYRMTQTKQVIQRTLAVLPWRTPKAETVSKQQKTPAIFTKLTDQDGTAITPVDRQFGLVIPKIGINAAVIPSVNPTDPGAYQEALTRGVAHASTSYFPDENGTVYLFSHSTSYDWFVKDLNAVFYLVKNLDVGDSVVIMYKGVEYDYTITDKKIVSPEAVSYLVPHAGTKSLILQTCWPPGSVTERLLLFAEQTHTDTQI